MNRNWTRTRIVNALREIGVSLVKLSKEHGLREYTLYSALGRPYPRGQKIIADALDRRRHEIWPEFYDATDNRITEAKRNREAFKAVRSKRSVV